MIQKPKLHFDKTVNVALSTDTQTIGWLGWSLLHQDYFRRYRITTQHYLSSNLLQDTHLSHTHIFLRALVKFIEQLDKMARSPVTQRCALFFVPNIHNFFIPVFCHLSHATTCALRSFDVSTLTARSVVAHDTSSLIDERTWTAGRVIINGVRLSLDTSIPRIYNPFLSSWVRKKRDCALWRRVLAHSNGTIHGLPPLLTVDQPITPDKLSSPIRLHFFLLYSLIKFLSLPGFIDPRITRIRDGRLCRLLVDPRSSARLSLSFDVSPADGGPRTVPRKRQLAPRSGEAATPHRWDSQFSTVPKVNCRWIVFIGRFCLLVKPDLFSTAPGNTKTQVRFDCADVAIFCVVKEKDEQI